LIAPLPALAPVFVIASAMLGAVGFASGTLAANERLYRLIHGPSVIRHHARYLARTSGAMTLGQLCGAAVIGLAGALYPAFALLYATSATIRVSAWRSAGERPAPAATPLSVGPVQAALVAPDPLAEQTPAVAGQSAN
jgi:hypothetical protein